MSLAIKKLPTNTLGKDYVIGDLHGCYHLLERLLTEVQFNPTQDRLFAVGDLIDRGPESLRCLQLLQEPWFFAVMGNHEQMLLEFFLSYIFERNPATLDHYNAHDLLANGGDWIIPYCQTGMETGTLSPELTACLAQLLVTPTLLIVGTGSHRFHVIHAELLRPNHHHATPPVWLDENIDQWFAADQLAENIEERLLWGRTLMSSAHYADIRQQHPQQPGLATTFCGHTYATNVRQGLSHICLDTGAFASYKADQSNNYGLTLFDVQRSRWALASYQRDEIVWDDLSAISSAQHSGGKYSRKANEAYNL